MLRTMENLKHLKSVLQLLLMMDVTISCFQNQTQNGDVDAVKTTKQELEFKMTIGLPIMFNRKMFTQVI